MFYLYKNPGNTKDKCKIKLTGNKKDVDWENNFGSTRQVEGMIVVSNGLKKIGEVFWFWETYLEPCKGKILNV